MLNVALYTFSSPCKKTKCQPLCSDLRPQPILTMGTILSTFRLKNSDLFRAMSSSKYLEQSAIFLLIMLIRTAF